VSEETVVSKRKKLRLEDVVVYGSTTEGPGGALSIFFLPALTLSVSLGQITLSLARCNFAFLQLSKVVSASFPLEPLNASNAKEIFFCGNCRWWPREWKLQARQAHPHRTGAKSEF
jgi:hypothetical protein